MTLHEFIRSMRKEAADCAKLGKEYQRQFEYLAMVYLVTSIMTASGAMILDFPYSIFMNVMSIAIFVMHFVQRREGDATYLRWLKLRQQCLDNITEAMERHS